jgi:hypothetical protein
MIDSEKPAPVYPFSSYIEQIGKEIYDTIGSMNYQRV